MFRPFLTACLIAATTLPALALPDRPDDKERHREWKEEQKEDRRYWKERDKQERKYWRERERESREHRPHRFLIMGAQPDAVGLMAGFDVFTLASHIEGLPVSFMEARALGLPIVVTAVGGLPDLITDNVDGLLVQPGSDEALTNALASVTESVALRNRLALASGARAADCDASIATAHIENCYMAAMTRHL